MAIVLNAILFIAAFAGMEVVAYLSHRYLMHGVLWSLHESHHVPHEGPLERNDWFGVLFAIPSIALIWLGVNVYGPLLWIGLGMTAYGVAYFAFHDLIVHRRVRVPYKPRDGYMQRIVAAHRMHHATRDRDGAVSFGFLWAPPIERLRRQREELARARPGAED